MMHYCCLIFLIRHNIKAYTTIKRPQHFFVTDIPIISDILKYV